MIRIRTGSSWRDDPRLSAALKARSSVERASAARELTDALAIEVDGVDLAAGLAEAPLLPSLEALLRAVAGVVSGLPRATVVLGDGGMELVLRRRGGSALLTVVALGRPSRILARDVEVEVEALAAAALEAAAGFCRELAQAVPGGALDARGLEVAARRLSRAQPRPAPVPGPAPALGALHPPPRALGCSIELADPDGLVAGYPGGRPDLGSLLVPGTVTLRDALGAALVTLPGYPFLALRDLTAAADGALCAARRGDSRVDVPLARPGRGTSVLGLELRRAAVTLDGRPVPCPPLALLQAFAEAAVEFCRLLAGHNPRQAENAHLAELEAAATARLAELDELSQGDLAGAAGPGPAVRGALAARVDRRPLGPGRLRHLSFRRLGSAEVGTPAGLWLGGAGVVAAGGEAIVCLDREQGAVRWRARGAARVAFLPGLLVAVRAEHAWALSPRTGRQRWALELPGRPPSGAALLPGGPLVLVEPGALTGLDPRSGEVRWRFAAPGATRTWVAGFGAVVVAGSDTGFLHGLDAGGRLVWRVRAPGPILGAPIRWGERCLALCETASGSALLALDAATGVRRFEAPLELSTFGAPTVWGRRLVVGGTVAGDAAVTALERGGARAWTSVPPLSGAPQLLPAGPLLVVRDAAGGMSALERDGRARWSRPAPESGWRGPRPLAVSRETLVTAGEGLTFHALASGELLGALPGISAAHLAVDGGLSLAALDLDGLLTVHRLGTHLSVV